MKKQIIHFRFNSNLLHFEFAASPSDVSRNLATNPAKMFWCCWSRTKIVLSLGEDDELSPINTANLMIFYGGVGSIYAKQRRFLWLKNPAAISNKLGTLNQQIELDMEGPDKPNQPPKKNLQAPSNQPFSLKILWKTDSCKQHLYKKISSVHTQLFLENMVKSKKIHIVTVNFKVKSHLIEDPYCLSNLSLKNQPQSSPNSTLQLLNPRNWQSTETHLRGSIFAGILKIRRSQNFPFPAFHNEIHLAESTGKWTEDFDAQKPNEL